MIGDERLSVDLIVGGKVAKQMGNTVAGHVEAYAEHLERVSQQGKYAYRNIELARMKQYLE